MSGLKGKLVSAKQGMFKVFRLTSGLGKEGFNASSSLPVSTVAPHETVNSLTSCSLAWTQPKAFNLQAYILANQRLHEIESQKATLLLLSRHERWKPGGPL